MLLRGAGNFHCLFHSICLCLPVPVSLCISGGDFSATLSASYKHTTVGGNK